MKMVEEKRRYNRFGFQKSVQVYPVLPSISGNIFEVQKESIEARASNVSEGGLALETSRPLNPDNLVKMNFEVADHQPVEVYGKIIWSRSNRCGVRFMYLDASLRKGVRSLA
jgi:hypothetical protein